jgi:hypothetical protein
MLTLPHIDAALGEMERGLEELGCVGLSVHTHFIRRNRSVAETEFEPTYAEVNRRVAFRAPVWDRDLLATHCRLRQSASATATPIGQRR